MAKNTPITNTDEANALTPMSKDALEEANKKIYSTYGVLNDLDVKTQQPITDSPDYFVGGIVPVGFTKTYGNEITDAEDGSVGEVMRAFHEVFNKEDGFRVFFKYLDGNTLTVVLPIKFAKNDPSYDELYMQVSKCDCRSLILRPGNYVQQVEQHAKRIAKRIGYQRGR